MRAIVCLLPCLFLTLSYPVHAAELPSRVYLNTWLVAGPFPNEEGRAFDRDFIGETTALPEPGITAAGRQWKKFDDRLYNRNYDDYNDLYCYFRYRERQPSESVLAYAHLYVFSPKEMRCQLRIGSNDGFKGWLNGNPIASIPGLRQALKDQDRIPITLRQGWNRLLLKVANRYKIWGFYARICGEDGGDLSDLEYSITKPGGPLFITTDELPKGHAEWPYIWLSVKGGKHPHAPSNSPSASPYLLMAAGGNPPYSWSLARGTLPPGLTLDPRTGALLGFAKEVGTHRFAVQVSDAAGVSAGKSLSLVVRERPTKWFEEARLGGLIHSRGREPQKQAELMARQGYQFCIPVSKHHAGRCSWATKVKTSSGKSGQYSGDEMGIFAKEVRKRNMRFGFYYSLSEQYETSFNRDDYFDNFPRYLDYAFSHLEELCGYDPCMFWFDGARAFPPKDRTTDYWEYDALYGMMKTLRPGCLILNNPGADTSSMDYGLGDVDVLSSEGWGGSYGDDWYWCNWPRSPEGGNPKIMPTEAWRYPNKDRARCDDWEEWIRVVVSMISEGFVCNLDHTTGIGLDEMRESMATWMDTRKDSLIGTYPGPLAQSEWGYSVIKGDTIYLHILRNKRGKTGWPQAPTLTVSPLPGKLAKAYLLPRKNPLRATQQGDRVVLQLSGIEPDPVDTIIALEMLPSYPETKTRP